jgi:hypothetical protein
MINMSWENILKKETIWSYDEELEREFPEIYLQVDYHVSQNPNLPMKDIPKLVKEAVAKFGKDLEEEMDRIIPRDEKGEKSGIVNLGDYTKKHKAFLRWLETK